MTILRPRQGFGLLREGAMEVGEDVSFRVSMNGPGQSGWGSGLRTSPVLQRWSVSSEADSQVPGVGGWPWGLPDSVLWVRLGRSQGGTAVWGRLPVCMAA